MKSDLLSLALNSESGEEPWEDFHEASKTSRFDAPPSNEEVRARMAATPSSLDYGGYTIVPLPKALPLHVALSQAMVARKTTRNIGAAPLPLEALASLLYYGMGETHDETDKGFPRPFRICPSGGAMYPLELYVHAARTPGLQPGIYHYHPGEHALRLLVDGDQTRTLGMSLVQQKMPLNCSALIFISAIFGRSTFKYGQRGYRFALLEAGHVAQNLILSAGGLGLGAVPVGGFFDREIDEILGLDGLDHSTLYLMAVGAASGDDWI
jgi:SagB-type dehydrogenase family enzyme